MQLVPPRIPLHLVAKTFLQDLPETLYKADASNGRGRARTMRLRIGGWINLPLGYQKPVSLLLVIQNGDGEQAVLIDEMNARGASEVLLSGEVELEVKDATGMQLYCGGIDDRSVWASNMSFGAVAENPAEQSPPARRRAG